MASDSANARFDFLPQPAAEPGAAESINRLYLADETAVLEELLAGADCGERGRERIAAQAARLVRTVRETDAGAGGIEAFLQQYDLSSHEGIVLMCIAEALLRIPDADTADRLIADKISAGKWDDHLGSSDSVFVNASTWGLMLTGRLLSIDGATVAMPGKLLGRLVGRAGEPVVRAAMRQAMRIMGHQFVMGRTIEEALRGAADSKGSRFRYSFDMLGEAALTAKDAERYFDSYANAIDAIGAASDASKSVFESHSISVKLSALHPRFEFSQRERALRELTDSVLQLAVRARSFNIALTLDAEEADRLELSLEIFAAVAAAAELRDWNGLGLAVQAYQKRAPAVIDWLIGQSAGDQRRIPVRLVKGAYWDTEIKHGQQEGLSGYPVFTRKVNTDVSYLACARALLAGGSRFYPQFATHNAHTIASVLEFADADSEYEFQRLHGMGESLYEQIIDKQGCDRPCRVYAPVGQHKDLLPYLVRRLLENGANTSFVNRINDEREPVEAIVADPIEAARMSPSVPHPRIPLPRDIFGESRRNARGHNIADRGALRSLLGGMQDSLRVGEYRAVPVVGGKRLTGERRVSVSPADTSRIIGHVEYANADVVAAAVSVAAEAFPRWARMPVPRRAQLLRAAADSFEENTPELLALCVAEAGKVLTDAIAELREAVDFLRYYASEAEAQFGAPRLMPGPTGESNYLGWRGRGVFVCISPWNFPLAIFTGQIAAALAAGNTVIAKPAEQTSLVAARAVELMHAAGIPGDVLQFVPGTGAVAGAGLVKAEQIAGVAFTGSTQTARLINQALAAREGPIAVLVAETGGQNAMIVDSSALPEQVVGDAVFSAFNSAGQRCSALRILCVQDDVADGVLELTRGCMDELVIGDGSDLSTDVGPLIDNDALTVIERHVAGWDRDAVLKQCELPARLSGGTFFPPTLLRLDNIGDLNAEVFGPVLHFHRYRGAELPRLIDAINATGYGLTLGIHSRVDSRQQQIVEHAGAGNMYINRDIVGAVVGVQPFGGRGLSGTGPKAGGPHYVLRFASEYTVTNNTSAIGGNASLLSLDD